MAVQWGLLKPPDYINQGISSFSQGFLTPFIAGREKQQAEMQQMQVQKAKQLQEAQNRYAQTGDPKELMAVNPQMAMQIEEYVRTRPPEEMVKLAKATQYMNLARPYLNQESWKQSIRPTMIQLGAPEQMLPPENASPEQLHQFVWGSDIMGASLKNMGKAFKGGEFVQTPSGLQQVPPTEEQKAKAQKERAQAGFYEKKAEDPYYGKTPEYIKPVGQPGGIIPHAPGTPVPEGYEFASKTGSGGEIDLTPPAIDAMAERYMLDGTMPGLGLGKAATAARSKVMNKVAEKMTIEGKTPQDLVAQKTVASGLKSEVQRLMGQRGPMLAFAKTADKNLDIALDLSKKVDRTGVPAFNRWLLAGRKSITGDSDVAAFHAATQVAINEFAKVTSSATGGGVTSDTARREIEEVLNTAQTPEQFKAVVNTLRADMSNRVSGYEDSLNRINESLKKLGQNQETSKPVGGSIAAKTTMTPSEQKAVDIANQNPQAKEDLKKNFPDIYKRAFPDED